MVALLTELRNLQLVASYKHSAPNGAHKGAVIIPQTVESYPQIALVIARGGVIAFRTDTFYGLGADPFNGLAVQKITKLKGREEGRPILIVISDPDQVERLITERSKEFGILVEKFWPGPLTLVGKAHPDLSGQITAWTASIGVRLPADDRVRALVRACGGALTATSANLSGDPPSRSATDVDAYFPGGVDLIVDGGEVTATLPSTVFDVSGASPRLVREGAISRLAITKVLG